MTIIATNSTGNPKFIRTDDSGNVQSVISDGTDKATVTAEGWLDVKTHTPEKCFAADYIEAQTAAVILTPTSGKKIKIIQVYASTSTTTTDITLYFTTSGNKFYKLYTAQKATAVGNIICGTGAANETVKLTCGANTFISIAYDEV